MVLQNGRWISCEVLSMKETPFTLGCLHLHRHAQARAVDIEELEVAKERPLRRGGLRVGSGLPK
eukprot:COSAG02_NODE_3761_length_6272_cov_5.833468_3_plen_64_part_00